MATDYKLHWISSGRCDTHHEVRRGGLDDVYMIYEKDEGWEV